MITKIVPESEHVNEIDWIDGRGQGLTADVVLQVARCRHRVWPSVSSNACYNECGMVPNCELNFDYQRKFQIM